MTRPTCHVYPPLGAASELGLRAGVFAAADSANRRAAQAAAVQLDAADGRCFKPDPTRFVIGFTRSRTLFGAAPCRPGRRGFVLPSLAGTRPDHLASRRGQNEYAGVLQSLVRKLKDVRRLACDEDLRTYIHALSAAAEIARGGDLDPDPEALRLDRSAIRVVVFDPAALREPAAPPARTWAPAIDLPAEPPPILEDMDVIEGILFGYASVRVRRTPPRPPGQ